MLLASSLHTGKLSCTSYSVDSVISDLPALYSITYSFDAYFSHIKDRAGKGHLYHFYTRFRMCTLFLQRQVNSLKIGVWLFPHCQEISLPFGLFFPSVSRSSSQMHWKSREQWKAADHTTSRWLLDFQMTSYRVHLGVCFYNSWLLPEQIKTPDGVPQKVQQRLLLLRRLKSLNIGQDIKTTVYRSVLTFNIASW